MKKSFLLALLLLLSVQNYAFAGGCIESSVSEEAMQTRMDEITGMYDSVVGNPSDSRSFSDCLSAIEDIGAIFSVGISLPSTTTILNNLCNSIDTQLDSIINDAKSAVMDVKNEVLDSSPVFSVVLSPSSVVNDLVGNLK